MRLRLGAEALAKAEEAVLADVAAQGNHADAAEDEIEEPAMRSADVWFTALRACDDHS